MSGTGVYDDRGVSVATVFALDLLGTKYISSSCAIVVSGKAATTIDINIHFLIVVIFYRLYINTVQNYVIFCCKDTEKP